MWDIAEQIKLLKGRGVTGKNNQRMGEEIKWRILCVNRLFSKKHNSEQIFFYAPGSAAAMLAQLTVWLDTAE